MSKIEWKSQPDKHDYDAAADYLDLISNSSKIVESLKQAEIRYYKAKDILRASQLPLLGTHNYHVIADTQKIADGEKLSPILLFRGNLAIPRPLIIADGYHRVCAVYWTDENEDIPCKLALA